MRPVTSDTVTSDTVTSNIDTSATDLKTGNQAKPLAVLLTTASSEQEALRLAHALVEARLVACAQIMAPIQSIYRWEGQIEQATEYGLVLKTAPEQLSALEAKLTALHSYAVPEFVVLEGEASKAYGAWVLENLAQNPLKS